MRDQYNAAAEKQTAEWALSSLPNEEVVTRKQLEAWVDELGDIGTALNAANPEDLGQLYRSLKLSLTYHHVDQRVDVAVDSMADRVEKVGVRGRIRTLTTRLELEPPEPDLRSVADRNHADTTGGPDSAAVRNWLGSRTTVFVSQQEASVLSVQVLPNRLSHRVIVAGWEPLRTA